MNIEQTKEQIKDIAAALGGGWRYHELATLEKKTRGHVLSNGAGLYIEVFSAYREPLPQFQLCYRDPKYKHYPSVITIGCSLTKPLSAIVADLKNRLLSHSGEVYQKLEQKTLEYSKAEKRRELERLQVEAFGRVARVVKVDEHSRFYYWRDEKDNSLSRMDYRDDVDSWDLDLYRLKADTVIKILALIEQERST